MNKKIKLNPKLKTAILSGMAAVTTMAGNIACDPGNGNDNPPPKKEWTETVTTVDQFTSAVKRATTNTGEAGTAKFNGKITLTSASSGTLATEFTKAVNLKNLTIDKSGAYVVPAGGNTSLKFDDWNKYQIVIGTNSNGDLFIVSADDYAKFTAAGQTSVKKKSAVAVDRTETMTLADAADFSAFVNKLLEKHPTGKTGLDVSVLGNDKGVHIKDDAILTSMASEHIDNADARVIVLGDLNIADMQTNEWSVSTGKQTANWVHASGVNTRMYWEKNDKNGAIILPHTAENSITISFGKYGDEPREVAFIEANDIIFNPPTLESYGRAFEWEYDAQTSALFVPDELAEKIGMEKTLSGISFTRNDSKFTEWLSHDRIIRIVNPHPTNGQPMTVGRRTLYYISAYFNAGNDIISYDLKRFKGTIYDGGDIYVNPNKHVATNARESASRAPNAAAVAVVIDH